MSNKSRLTSLLLVTLIGSHTVQSAEIRSKALGSAYTAMSGDNNSWAHNPAGAAWHNDRKELNLNLGFKTISDGNFNDNDSEFTFSDVGINIGWQTDKGNNVVIGTQLNSSDSGTETGQNDKNLIPETFLLGASYFHTATQISYGASLDYLALKGNGFEPNSDMDLAYKIGLQRYWQLSIKPAAENYIFTDASVGINYQSGSELTLTQGENAGLQLSMRPEIISVGGRIGINYPNEMVNQQFNILTDYATTSYIESLQNSDKSVVNQLGFEWVFYGDVDPTSSRQQLALRSGIQFSDLKGIDPVYSYGASVSYGRHIVDVSYWQDFSNRNRTIEHIGVEYNFIY